MMVSNKDSIRQVLGRVNVFKESFGHMIVSTIQRMMWKMAVQS